MTSRLAVPGTTHRSRVVGGRQAQRVARAVGQGGATSTSAWIHLTQAKARCGNDGPERRVSPRSVVSLLEDLFSGSFLVFSAMQRVGSHGHSLGTVPPHAPACCITGCRGLPDRLAAVRGWDVNSAESNTYDSNVARPIIPAKPQPGRAEDGRAAQPFEVRHLLVDENSEGQRLDNFLIGAPEGRAEDASLPGHPQRRGARQQGPRRCRHPPRAWRRDPRSAGAHGRSCRRRERRRPARRRASFRSSTKTST